MQLTSLEALNMYLKTSKWNNFSSVTIDRKWQNVWLLLVNEYFQYFSLLFLWYVCTVHNWRRVHSPAIILLLFIIVTSGKIRCPNYTSLAKLSELILRGRYIKQEHLDEARKKYSFSIFTRLFGSLAIEHAQPRGWSWMLSLQLSDFWRSHWI